MPRPLGTVAALGLRVAGVLAVHRAANESVRTAVRVRLVSSVSDRARSRPVEGKWLWAAAAAAAVLVVSIGWFLRREPRPLAFTAAGASGQLQEWLAAPEGTSMPIRFTDGTGFEVRPKSRVRVVDTAVDGARIAIERGELRADVVPRPHGSWWVIAGPFSVHVTGTAFDVRWDPTAERFSVFVSKGSIAVSGPMVGTSRLVSAGYRLTAYLPQAKLEVTTAPVSGAAFERGLSDAAVGVEAVGAGRSGALSDAEAKPAAGEDGAELGGITLSGEGASATAGSPTGALERPAPVWQQLAKAGKLKQAFASAEGQGFSRLCESSSAADLLLLGDAARLAGRPERAAEALLSLRRRFPSDSRSAAAAFALGKVAFDQRHAYAEAANWFAASLKEQPGGSLSREASGRLIEALRNAGDLSGAKQAAKSYLERYPEGPHVTVARALLE